MYAVIENDLADEQIYLVHNVLDRLKEAGAVLLDWRDVDIACYEKMFAACNMLA
jgi:hypothetical protein